MRALLGTSVSCNRCKTRCLLQLTGAIAELTSGLYEGIGVHFMHVLGHALCSVTVTGSSLLLPGLTKKARVVQGSSQAWTGTGAVQH